MSSIKTILSAFLGVVVIVSYILAVTASPVPNEDADTEGSRQGRFYGNGVAASQATAFASGNGMGYPGFGGSSSNAFAAANSVASGGGMGYPYGR